MSRNLNQITQKLETLEKEKVKLQNQKRLKLQAQKNNDRKIARRERNHRIYTVGGLVEKMGLDKLEEVELLGLLHRARYFYEKADSERLTALKTVGSQYIEQGKRLSRLKSK